MSETRTMLDERSLLEQLCTDVDNSNKEDVLFLVNFPLRYHQTPNGPFRGVAVESFREWEDFSPYSLDLSARVAQHAKTRDKRAKIALFADDHKYEPRDNTQSWVRTARARLYKERSGEAAKLPEELQTILDKYSLSKEDILRQDQGVGRRDCLYHSERLLIGPTIEKDWQSACEKEVTRFLRHAIDKKTTYFIGMIPDRCAANVCEGVLGRSEFKNIAASFVMMKTETELLTSSLDRAFRDGEVIYHRA